MVSSTRSGEGSFSSGKICARANAPQNGRLLCGGAPENKSGALHAEESPSPSTGVGRWGLMLQRTSCGRKGKKKEKNKNEKKGRRKEGNKSQSINLFLFGILAVLE